MNAFEARCTWEAVDGKNLNQTVSWLDRKESSDIEDIIQAENCLLLEASQEEPECKLRLSSKDPSYCIQSVAVLCEARLMEVFGNHEEYLQTVRGGIVDEMEDMIVYRGDIPFQPPVGECTVKFAALKNKSKMWLYGVVVKIQMAPLPPNPTPIGPKERIHPSYALAAQLLQMVSGSQAPLPQNKTDRGCQTEEIRHEKDTQTVVEEQENLPTVVEQTAASSGGTSVPSPEALARLSESITAGVESSLEQMEERLWAKMQQRIYEMERGINQHIQEIVDALKEDEDDEEGEEEDGPKEDDDDSAEEAVL